MERKKIEGTGALTDSTALLATGVSKVKKLAKFW